jgi:hypothetical protein
MDVVAVRVADAPLARAILGPVAVGVLGIGFNINGVMVCAGTVAGMAGPVVPVQAMCASGNHLQGVGVPTIDTGLRDERIAERQTEKGGHCATQCQRPEDCPPPAEHSKYSPV